MSLTLYKVEQNIQFSYTPVFSYRSFDSGVIGMLILAARDVGMHCR